MGDKSQDDRYDYLEYLDQLSEEEAKLVKQFYKEYYFDGLSTTAPEDRVIQDLDAQAEARRNHNSMKTDMLFRAKKDGKLSQVYENSQQFMDDASDEWDWQNAFKVGGYELALGVIHDQALRDLENNELDRTIVLTRYYEKRDRLRKVLNREKKK